jgi:Fe2+ or Zn2+ uptake regulation protein
MDVTEMFDVRKQLRQKEQSFGVKLTRNQLAIVEFIASREGTTIKDITEEGYFNDLSLSTIKRCVEKIKDKKLVKILKHEDKRNKPMILRKQL